MFQNVGFIRTTDGSTAANHLSGAALVTDTNIITEESPRTKNTHSSALLSTVQDLVALVT